MTPADFNIEKTAIGIHPGAERIANVDAIEKALEAAGVVFVDPNGYRSIASRRK